MLQHSFGSESTQHGGLRLEFKDQPSLEKCRAMLRNHDSVHGNGQISRVKPCDYVSYGELVQSLGDTVVLPPPT
jgi:hypothetical protein